MKNVVVFGATGYTGRLVTRALVEMGVKGVIVAGRDEKKLQELAREQGGLEHRVGDATKGETLGRVVEGAHVVVDTAGPFTLYGEPVLRAALGARAHFLDTTGEQSYMNRVLERYHGMAKERRLVVVNAQAFEFALGYLASALLAEWDPAIHTIDVFNRVQGFGATPGTLLSGVEALTTEGFVRKGGRLVPRGPSPLPLWVQIPGRPRREPAVPCPGGEALHLAHAHPEVRNVTTNLVLPPALAAPAMLGWSVRSLLKPLDKLGALDLVRKRIATTVEGPPAEERERARFDVFARGRSEVATRGILVSGRDPYGITGVLAALGAKRLLEGEPLAHGVVSTDQAFGAREFLEALAPFGVTWSKHDVS